MTWLAAAVSGCAERARSYPLHRQIPQGLSQSATGAAIAIRPPVGGWAASRDDRPHAHELSPRRQASTKRRHFRRSAPAGAGARDLSNAYGATACPRQTRRSASGLRLLQAPALPDRSPLTTPRPNARSFRAAGWRRRRGGGGSRCCADGSKLESVSQTPSISLLLRIAAGALPASI